MKGWKLEFQVYEERLEMAYSILDIFTNTNYNFSNEKKTLLRNDFIVSPPLPITAPAALVGISRRNSNLPSASASLYPSVRYRLLPLILSLSTSNWRFISYRNDFGVMD